MGWQCNSQEIDRPTQNKSRGPMGGGGGRGTGGIRLFNYLCKNDYCFNSYLDRNSFDYSIKTEKVLLFDK